MHTLWKTPRSTLYGRIPAAEETDASLNTGQYTEFRTFCMSHLYGPYCRFVVH